MQFKHPEILYALCLLLIPIIVHLFQLRRFKKEAFTNVALLKQVVIQTRKSSQLKKWLTLLTRMLLLACLIVAFAQPYTSKNSSFSTKPETVIYLDNSFSLQAKGEEGELLKRAVQEIIDESDPNEKLSIITNDVIFKNSIVRTIQNDLLKLGYASNQLSYDAAILKSKNLFSKESTLRNLIYISDFQQKDDAFTLKNDSLYNINLVKLKPVVTSNISIDSAYIEKKSNSTSQLKVVLKNSANPVNNIPVSLFDGEKLLAKTSVSIDKEEITEFTIANQVISNGRIIIDDNSLQFDNVLYFNINSAPKTNLLVIGDIEDTYLNRLYNTNEFNYVNTRLSDLNYSIIDAQNVVILNELDQIPSPLTNTLKTFMNNGGFVIVIPSINSELTSYNSLLNNYSIRLNEKISTEKRVTSISYGHPIFKNVFDKQVSNFQYPKVTAYFSLTFSKNTMPLKFEDGNPFLIDSGNLYMFSAPLNLINSSFSNSPLIVPTFYNIANLSLKTPSLYYTIGTENTIDIAINMKQDAILNLKNDTEDIIPRQQYFNNKVTITTNETPSKAGIYDIENKEDLISKISFNYNRIESNLLYQDISDLSQVSISESVSETIKTLKSNSKINELWKWFVIFALAFLIFEMLILKYF